MIASSIYKVRAVNDCQVIQTFLVKTRFFSSFSSFASSSDDAAMW